jgi:hypothetical protein
MRLKKFPDDTRRSRNWLARTAIYAALDVVTIIVNSSRARDSQTAVDATHSYPYTRRNRKQQQRLFFHKTLSSLIHSLYKQ